MKGYAVSDTAKKGSLIYVLFCVCVLTGAAAVGCVLFWKFNYDGGLAWRDDPGRQFAWHPILLTLAIVLSGLGGTLYRVLTISRAVTKSIHWVLMLLSIVCGGIGLWAVLDSHNLASPPIPNFFSLHSWLGLMTLCVLGLQFVMGTTMFILPCCSSSKKAAYLPLHKYFGIATLVGATAAAVIGLTEEALFSLPNYTDMPEKGLVINAVGICLAVFTSSVIFINTYRGFKVFN